MEQLMTNEAWRETILIISSLDLTDTNLWSPNAALLGDWFLGYRWVPLGFKHVAFRHFDDREGILAVNYLETLSCVSYGAENDIF